MRSLQYFPAVLLTGARQVGKSTLVRNLVRPSWNARYITFDDRAFLDAALRDPDGFIAGLPEPVIIDEVQKAPDVMRAIKKVIDRDRKPGQYLLTGSANISTLKSTAETLAGRISLHTLYPFCRGELLGKPPTGILEHLFEAADLKKLQKLIPMRTVSAQINQLRKRITAGGYPVPALIDSESARDEWFSSYRQTYLERDLLNIRAMENIPDFNRLFNLLAFRTGKLLNLSDLSRDTGLPYTTLRRYMNLLEVTYQIYYLKPYYTYSPKRLIKTPKIYFNDTGMAIHLRGASDWSVLEKQGDEGSMFETWVASEIQKLISVSENRLNLFFWRTQTGQEVDFIIERGADCVAVEVKWSHRIDNSVVNNLKSCEEHLGKRLRFSVILYTGDEVVPLTPKIIAVPFSSFF